MLAVASPAAAQDVIPPDNSGADQYVPPVPDPGGNRPSAPGTGGPGNPLPTRISALLPPGSEGRLLSRLATDPGSGAPPRTGRDGGGSGDGGAGAAGGGSGESGDGGAGGAQEADATAASAITSSISDNASVGVLVAALVALTLAAGALRLAQRPRRRSFRPR